MADLYYQSNKSLYSIIYTPLTALFYLGMHLIWIVFWPVINLFEAYLSDGQYQRALGEVKTAKHRKLEAKITQSVRAHMFEVCIESTFQVIR